MANLKLTYFDFHGGRGEPARLALSIGGIPFEDDRVAFADWERRKEATPVGALPVREVEGQTLSQTEGLQIATERFLPGLCHERLDKLSSYLPHSAGS